MAKAMAKDLTAASASSAVTYKEHLLLVGGHTTDGKTHSKIVFLDQPQDLTLAPLCAEASWVSVCTLPDGLIASGGYNAATKSSESRVQKFSLKDSSWTVLPDMLNRIHLHGSVCVDNRFFAIAGQCKGTNGVKNLLASVSVLDLLREEWTGHQALDIAVDGPGVVGVDSEIYVFGGHDGVNHSTQAYKYDARTGKRTICKPVPKPCSPWNRTVAVGRRYIFVLHNDGRLFMQYDTECDQWSELPCLEAPLKRSAMVFHNSRLFVLGGYESDRKKPNSRIQTYDVDKKSWCLENQTTPLPLCFHAAIVLKGTLSLTF